VSDSAPDTQKKIHYHIQDCISGYPAGPLIITPVK
jgi:hypothetical protein